jgi:DMSO/TMAO reductase YedYZ molybdopterin-dependent catalytic subunit
MLRRDFLVGLSNAVVLQTLCPSAGPPGELLGTVPFAGARAYETPLGRLVGGPGLDARMFTDLGDLAPEMLITPSSRVFIRTTAPPEVAARLAQWSVVAGGTALSLGALTAQARPMGAHLIECAGNTDPQNFGLMSAAEWDGVPLADVVKQLRPDASAFGVRISGLDHEAQVSRQSIAGASWVFSLEVLERLGAFFAVRMNGEPLPPDHGAPVRLVVPGWYGCTWIKWVNDIRLVGPDEPATSQMREFAGRTHQTGVPERARDYAPASIDMAAMPIRIEKRRVNGRVQYRVIGIVWGGDRTIDRLMIRFSSEEQWKPFEICPAQRTHRTWSLWEYRWKPERTGVHDIVLKTADPRIRTRRLDVYFYSRRVRIDEV